MGKMGRKQLKTSLMVLYCLFLSFLTLGGFHLYPARNRKNGPKWYLFRYPAGGPKNSFEKSGSIRFRYYLGYVSIGLIKIVIRKNYWFKIK